MGVHKISTTGTDGGTGDFKAHGRITSLPENPDIIVQAYQWVGDGQQIYFDQPLVQLAKGEMDEVSETTLGDLQSMPWHYGSDITAGGLSDDGHIDVEIVYPAAP